MNPERIPSPYGSWKVDSHPTAIEYSNQVMADIAAFAVDGMQRLARGGIEVGGVLFGSRKGANLRIEAWRPMSCEHARGPSFLLSTKDEAALGKLLSECESDPELKGYEALGWFHSHTRSELCFTDEDLLIYDRFFAELWQVALVLKPKKLQPVSAGFFLRELGGKVRTGASLLEFEIAPSKTPPGQPKQNGPIRLAAPATAEIPAPVRVERRVPSPFSFKWLTLSAVLLMLLTGARIFLMSAKPAPPPSLPVKITDLAGNLQIEWDKDAKEVQNADSAQIRITDGSADVVKALDADTLHQGSFHYVRRGEDLQIKISLFRSGKTTVTEFARFIGPKLTRTALAEGDPTVLQLQNVIRENQRLQQQLKKETARANRLERSLRNLLAATKRE